MLLPLDLTDMNAAVIDLVCAELSWMDFEETMPDYFELQNTNEPEAGS